MFTDSYLWSDGFSQSATITVTVEDAAPGFEGQYKWNYQVVSDSYEDIPGTGYENFTIPLKDPEEYGIDGAQLTVGNIGTDRPGWVGDVGLSPAHPLFSQDLDIWWVNEAGSPIEFGQSANFWFTTVPTTISSGTGRTQIIPTGIAMGINGTIAAPVAPDPLKATILDDEAPLPPDDGLVSLREAIGYANTKAVANPNKTFNITFGPKVQQGRISLTSELTINANTTIIGTDKLGVVGMNGDDRCRVFTIGQNRIVTIENLWMYNGGTTTQDPNGGVIKLETGSNLTLRKCLVTDGKAEGDGGGIWVGTNAILTLTATHVSYNIAKGNGGGIASANAKEIWILGTAGQQSVIQANTAEKDGGGVWFTGAGAVNQTKLTIDRTKIHYNSAEGKGAVGGNGGGLYLEWSGNTTNNKPVSIERTEITNNFTWKGYAGGIYLRASTTFGTGVKVLDSRAGMKDGIGILAFPSTKNDFNGVEIKGCRYVDPNPPPSSPHVGGEGGELVSEVFLDPEDDPDYLPSAIYISEGAEFVLSGAIIEDNDGVGVRGMVISLGSNYVENSLSSSSGWTGTDVVT